jgi:ankyrin repeat protein
LLAAAAGNGYGSEPRLRPVQRDDVKAKSQVIEPELKQCRLEVSRQSLKPVQIVTPSRRVHRTTNHRITVEKDTLTAWRQSEAKPAWTAKSADGHHLQWMTSDRTTAYLLSYLVDKDGHFDRYSSPAEVRRLDLETGHWLTSLRLGSGDGKDRHTDAVLRVLTGEGYVAVLSRQAKSGEESEPDVVSYEVSCFSQGKAKPLWSKVLPAAGNRAAPGVYLLAARSPDYADSSLNELAWMDDTLLVCSEAVQPLRCLNRDTGSTIWELERPWEFERGFIGPSVWSHYLERFGLDSWDVDADQVAAARKKFDERFNCAIIGGPVVVPVTFKRGWLDTHSIFLAVAKGPREGLSGYISDCIPYEFNDRGKPVSTVKLPYMVSGSQTAVLKDGVVWKCQNEGFLHLAVAKEGGRGDGPGGPDLLSRIVWFRRIQPVQPRAWLLADRACDAVAFGQGFGFCFPSGGNISNMGDSIYHFPVSAINLQTCVDQQFWLHVPFKGKVPSPKTNFSGIDVPGGRDAIHTFGPYLLGLTQLRLEGSVLEITLGMEDWSAAVHFDLSETDFLRSPVRRQPDQDDVKEWLRSLGNVNQPNAQGFTPLVNVCDDADSRYVRALLAAGADVKAKSKNGWTTLMSAACYGTAEVVQLLIDAGSDVNARDGNQGGQTTLMWAAGGLREQKKKVQALIKAGADPKAVTPDGWTLLMSAASRGQLPTVELLLETGLDVNARTKKGETPLMMAARHESARVVPVLLKAGAQVDARDHKGRTPLMYAADTGNPGNIKALLEAGADPNAKDKDGRTALDLARKSDFVGSAARVKVLEAASKSKTKK